MAQTYQAKKRIVKATGRVAKFSFPNDGEIRFEFTPGEPFGVGDGPSRTIPLGSKAQVTWNANLGRDWAVPEFFLSPIYEHLLDAEMHAHFSGNALTVRRRLYQLNDFGSIDKPSSIRPSASSERRVHRFSHNFADNRKCWWSPIRVYLCRSDK
jgi:hypothetical protein